MRLDEIPDVKVNFHIALGDRHTPCLRLNRLPSEPYWLHFGLDKLREDLETIEVQQTQSFSRIPLQRFLYANAQLYDKKILHRQHKENEGHQLSEQSMTELMAPLWPEDMSLRHWKTWARTSHIAI